VAGPVGKTPDGPALPRALSRRKRPKYSPVSWPPATPPLSWGSGPSAPQRQGRHPPL